MICKDVVTVFLIDWWHWMKFMWIYPTGKIAGLRQWKSIFHLLLTQEVVEGFTTTCYCTATVTNYLNEILQPGINNIELLDHIIML